MQDEQRIKLHHIIQQLEAAKAEVLEAAETALMSDAKSSVFVLHKDVAEDQNLDSSIKSTLMPFLEKARSAILGLGSPSTRALKSHEHLTKADQYLKDRLRISTHITHLTTNEGLIHIVTKKRWLLLFPLPHTSVMPHNARDLKNLGTFIKWNTNDGVVLSYVHGAIIRLVKQVGLAGLIELKNSVMMTERVSQTFGGSWHDIVKQAVRENVAFPVPDDVLKYIKGFM